MSKNSIKFEDYSDEVIKDFKSKVIEALHESAGTIEGQVKRNSRVDTSQLKGSWTYKVDEDNYEAHIGSPLENAIWEEFGTGEYAVKGNGRKTPWRYKDAKGNWHTTKGKTPNRTLENAFRTKLKTVKNIMERCLKN